MLENWDQFISLINGRDVYIFGGNVEGVGISRMMESNGKPAKAFLDTRNFNGGILRGLPVISPKQFIDNPRTSLIIICTKHRDYRSAARQFCSSRGYSEGVDFIFNSSLCQYFPTIETVGLCNLRCITCDMGIPGANLDQKMMSVEKFEEIIKKLKKEVPFLNSVALYLWGEPLLHPKNYEIINICHQYGIATEFSSNLNNIKNLDQFIAADPDILIVTSSGFGKNYEITHTGGKFEKFRNNCVSLRNSIDKHQAETFVKYHYLVYNNNGGAELLAAKAFAESLGFQFAPILANIFPGKIHDHVVLGEPLPDVMIEANKYLVYEINDQIIWAQNQKEKSCPVINAFPTIKWNGSVMHCCNMTKPTVGNDDFLDVSMVDLLDVRHKTGFCQRCQEHGMHRVFDVNGRSDNKMSEIIGNTPSAITFVRK